jgi:hypothetical protein
MKRMSGNGISVFLDDPMLLPHAWPPGLCPCEGLSSRMDCQQLLVLVEQPEYHQCLPKERKNWFSGQIYWNKIQ